MKYSVFGMRLLSLLLILLTLYAYQVSAQSRSAETARVKAQALQLRRQREAEERERLAILAQKYKNGTFEGAAEGFGGPVRVRVVIQDGNISEIDVTEHSGEDEIYFGMASAVIEDIIAYNDPQVDVVSSATFSSQGIIHAVENAVSKAVKS